MTDNPTRSESRRQISNEQPQTEAGRSTLRLATQVAEKGSLTMSLNDLRHRIVDIEEDALLLGFQQAEAAAPDAGLRKALRHALKYANRIYEQREWSEADLLEIIHAADDALAAHPAPAGPAVDAPDLDAMESLRMLFDMLERLDGQSDIGPMVQVTSAMWRDIVRPAIQQVRTALPRSLPSEPPRDPEPER